MEVTIGGTCGFSKETLSSRTRASEGSVLSEDASGLKNHASDVLTLKSEVLTFNKETAADGDGVSHRSAFSARVTPAEIVEYR